MAYFFKKWTPTIYVLLMALIMLGYVQYDPYQIDGDAVSYMDIASSILHGRWHEIVNGLWNPGYPALLALGKLLTHAGRMQELYVFYWVNYCIFLGSIACTWFFIQSILQARSLFSTKHSEIEWTFSASQIFLIGYATVFLSWQNEFSLGKIRVDGLFASLLLLAFGFLFRAVFTPSLLFDVGVGCSLGLAYLVKSPGFVLAAGIFFLLATYKIVAPETKYRRWRIGISIVAFSLVSDPYITALSMQKGRFDVGDSARLNYAWYVSGTEPEHLLNNQHSRFGDAAVNLQHSEIQMPSSPIVMYFPHFQHATYGPWFDPSYFNEGVKPRFNLLAQLQLTIQQSRHLFLFTVIHADVLALLAFCIVCGMQAGRALCLRWILVMIYVILLFSIAMYLCVHFLDRYIAGQFWAACIATFAILTYNKSKHTSLLKGASAFFAIVIVLHGVQSVVELRQTALLSGVEYGWQRTTEFDTASKLLATGILPGDSVSCFRACNTGAYWARLAGIHVNSAIYDPLSMLDTDYGPKLWQGLPDKSKALQALRSVGDKALVGYFEGPPVARENWRHLAGDYYYLSLSVGNRMPTIR